MSSKPAFILNIIISTDLVDINLTPDKREVVLIHGALIMEELRNHLEVLFSPSKYTFQVSQYSGNDNVNHSLKMKDNNTNQFNRTVSSGDIEVHEKDTKDHAETDLVADEASECVIVNGKLLEPSTLQEISMSNIDAKNNSLSVTSTWKCKYCTYENVGYADAVTTCALCDSASSLSSDLLGNEVNSTSKGEKMESEAKPLGNKRHSSDMSLGQVPNEGDLNLNEELEIMYLPQEDVRKKSKLNLNGRNNVLFTTGSGYKAIEVDSEAETLPSLDNRTSSDTIFIHDDVNHSAAKAKWSFQPEEALQRFIQSALPTESVISGGAACVGEEGGKQTSFDVTDDGKNVAKTRTLCKQVNSIIRLIFEVLVIITLNRILEKCG